MRSEDNNPGGQCHGASGRPITTTKNMTEQQQLLDAVRGYCDPRTGEVLERIPDELMNKLRAAKLAKGIPRRPSKRTGSSATWYVFLNGDIKDRVLALRRRPKQGRAKNTPGKRTAGVGTDAQAKRNSGGEGLRRYLNRRKTDQ
jgi:hypothetical protein